MLGRVSSNCDTGDVLLWFIITGFLKEGLDVVGVGGKSG